MLRKIKLSLIAITVATSVLLFSGCGAAECTEHSFDNSCDTTCNNENCDFTRESTHTFTFSCDPLCDTEGCGFEREVEHRFELKCDAFCSVNGCDFTREPMHEYSNDCDPVCDVEGCFEIRDITHKFSHSLDTVCDVEGCGEQREIGKQAVLLLGQSNMAGAGSCNTVAPIIDSRLSMMRNDKWVSFCEPLHVSTTKSGIGLGGSFAKAFVETFDCELGVIPAAKSGTSLEDWAVGGELYDNAVRLAKIAQKDSEICAILWHQGEANQNDTAYAAKFKVIIDSLLDEIGVDKEDIVIVTGELFGTRSDAVHRPQLEKLAEHYPNYGIAESDGLTVFDVTTHFDSQSYRVFGYRYFNVFYNILTGGTYEFDDNPESYYLEPGVDTEYITAVDFNHFAPGPLYGMTDLITLNRDTGAVDVIEISSSEKYLSLKTGEKSEGVWGSALVDIYGTATATSTVVFEAKFKLGEGTVSAADIFKVSDSNTSGATWYNGLRLTADGKLYDRGTGTQVALNASLKTDEWTTIKVVMDFENNLKDIYVNSVLVADNVPITSGTVSEYDILKCRVVHFVNNGSCSGEILVDDYKFYVIDESLK
ncbi:MAG: hypothetical protein IJX97_03660 [Clostridia bacterium]|nr:hypothetical protein [Clostridia bacterium]MBQ8720301.1 hypothetical protein [Clostridia bacterium]